MHAFSGHISVPRVMQSVQRREFPTFEFRGSSDERQSRGSMTSAEDRRALS